MGKRSKSSTPKPKPGPSKPKSGKRPKGKYPRLRATNAERAINKLPPELLLRIFIIGDEEERAKPARVPYYGFQDLVVRVCTHWRNLAINSPTLWTYIYVSRELSHESAALYLSRTTRTSLLDINLEMMEDFFEGDCDPDSWSSKIYLAKKTIDFLVENGASISQWKSLIARSGVPQVLYKILEHIHPQSAPSLKFLSVQWLPRLDSFRAMQDETLSVAYSHMFDRVYPETGDKLPQLRHVQFKAIPADFLFRKPLPMLAGLTHLELTLAFNTITHSKLCTLLLANPRLQSLVIGDGFVNDPLAGESTNTRVALPELRSLSLSWRSSISWARGVLNMIDAPGIESLKLACEESEWEKVLELIDQIAGDSDSPPAIAHNQPQSRQHMCPSLRTLDISTLLPDDDCPDIPRKLFSILPGITRLSAGGIALAALRGPPWFLPHLKHVDVSGEPPEDLGRILQCRIDGGFPVTSIGIEQQHFDSATGDTLPASLTLVRLPNPVEQDYYEFEEELDDDGFDDFDGSDGFEPEFGYFGDDGLGHDWLSDDDMIGFPGFQPHYVYSDDEHYHGNDYDDYEW
ncbi:F-box-like protein [Ceratobasidium sp. AG-Ba]|nr:F-box-like protein [Ceratobasidium sp. AG-Ba]